MRKLPIAFVLVAACGGGFPQDDEKVGSEADIVACPRGSTVQGIDISEWQGSINWSAVVGSGKKFAWARVSDGYYHDKTFAQNWPAMKRAGIIRGVYQFFEPNEDPVGQANLLIDAVGGHLEAGELPPMLDMESANRGTSAAHILWAMHAWADRIQTVLHKKPIIYTGAWWWNPWTGDSSQFNGYPLADSYYSTSCPNIAAGWSNWTVWQYSSSGHVGGISGRVDLDEFNGTEAELRAFAGGGGTPGGGVCSGKSGLWCGSELGLDGSTLYKCDGSPIVEQHCSYGCHVNPPGVNDACNAAPPPPNGPCGNRWGIWCGGTLGLNPNELYECKDGKAIAEKACQYGCQVEPNGVADQCKAPPTGPCTGREAGLWCGAALGLNSGELYRCSGGANATAVQSCGYGCQQNPPGTNDVCKPKPPPTGPCTGKASGLYCGAAIGLQSSELYECSGGADATPYDSCNYGCASGACKPQPGACSGRHAGFYCGSELGLEADELYQCDGSAQPTPYDSCNDGCQVNPPGVDDACKLPAGPCTAKAPGLYCGGSIGLEADTLYTCASTDSEPVASELCDYGCSNKACQAQAPGPCAGKQGLFCGSAIGLTAGSLYSCDGSSDAYEVEACAQGCQRNEPSNDDACYDADCSDKADGYYCGRAVSGNPAYLYSCQYGGVAASAPSSHCQ